MLGLIFTYIPFLAEEASKADPKANIYNLLSALAGSLITGGLAWYANRNKNKNDQFASFMQASEKYREELRGELERQEQRCKDEISKLKVMVKDQDILIKVLEEKQSIDIRYKTLIDALPQIVWTAKADGNVDYYNARGYQYAGRTLTYGKDYGWSLVFHPEDMQRGIEIWNNCVKTGDTYYYAYRLKRGSDGMYRWHLGIAFPRINEQGEIVQWVGSCTDIHDYREDLLKDYIPKPKEESAK